MTISSSALDLASLSNKNRVIPIILCGGAGSRLWPLSREQHPKPFIRLSDGQTLLQKAFLRASALFGVDTIVSVTNREFFFRTEEDLSAVNDQVRPLLHLLEPEAKNTAPAILAAALAVADKFSDDVVLVALAADHLIQNGEAFNQAIQAAVKLAEDKYLVTLGIEPTHPETGYGYIQAQSHQVLRFVEKPNLKDAEAYMASGDYLWNSGIFCFQVKTLLAEARAHCPTILSAVEQVLKASRREPTVSGEKIVLDAAAFSTIQSDSIDYAIVEKSKRIAVVPCDMGWSDIGSWASLSDLTPPDDNGNRIQGEALVYDSKNCAIQATDRLVGVVGVENLVIVDTPDALLVADKSRSQDVKKIYAQLKATDHVAHKLHKTVHRPWGTYTVLEEGLGFKIKRIEVKPKASLSLQMHYHRSEHWVVVSGQAVVTRDTEKLELSVNQSTYIPAMVKHRLCNPSEQEVCVLIEVQCGGYLGEDDIVRFDDIYGRCQDEIVAEPC
jgi:mannose-1-phosphate guanylyltransferase/mannose-6-phosphate isomerase